MTTKYDNPRLGLQALTVRQREVWEWIRAYHRETGQMPTLRAMEKGLRLGRSSLCSMLDKFVLAGLLESGEGDGYAALRMREGRA